MKLQLDTTAKTIKIEESVNLGELINSLEKLLPDGLWKEFKLETNTIINWNNPIVIDKYVPYVPYVQPWWNKPYIMYNNLSTTTDATNRANLVYGVYNVEI